MPLSIFQTIRIYLTLLVFLLIPSIASAVEISNIYQVDIEVREQSKKARWQASLEGLKLVLVRRSGNRRILDSKKASEAYKKVTSYLQKFEYSRNAELENDNKYVISLYFEPRLIDDLIKAANQPLWDVNRPVSILWLAQEEIDQNSSLYRRIIIENDNELFVNELINKNSRRRGVPIILPLMDLDDALLVSQSDVWGRFPEAIVEASNRYSVDSIIVGKVFQRGGLWFGQFSYFNQAKNISFEHQSDGVEEIYKQMFDSLAEVLCDQYCVTQTLSQGQELLIEIKNITNFKTFQKVKNYLSELSAVRQVDVLNINQDKLVLRLSLLSNEKTVVDSLRLNRRLKIVEAAEVEPTAKNEDSLEIKGSLENGTFPETGNAADNSQGEELTLNNIEEVENVNKPESILRIKTLHYRWVD